MNCSSQKSPRRSAEAAGFSQSRRAAVLGGFCNTLHEGNEIFRTFGDRLFSLLTLEQLQSFLDSKAHLSHTVALARIVREDFNASLASSPGGTRHGSFHPSPLITPMSKRQLDRPIYETRTPQGRTRLGKFSRHATDLLVTDDAGVDLKAVADLMSQRC
jgi:hypothetical protein